MRCGKDTEEKAVFCPECLEDMARHPVNPGTTVHIPVRHAEDIRKPVKKKPEVPLEEQLRKANSAVRILCYVAAGLLVALMITGVLLFHTLNPPTPPADPSDPPMGRNFTVTSSMEGE